MYEANTQAELTDSCRPRLAPGVRLHCDRFTGDSLLLFPEAMVKLQGSGAAIIPLCDGRRVFSEIVSILSERFRAPPAVLRADVTRYLLRLGERMLVQFENSAAGADGPPAVDVAAASPSGSAATATLPVGLPRPLGLIAEVSYRCPLHCPYCSNPVSLLSSAAVELTTEQWQRVLGEAADVGVFHALFSGGEPLVRSDLEQLIGHARGVGLYTNLITSAVGFTTDRARALKAAGLDSVQISFQSDQAELADLVAGTRAHALKLEAAQIARDAGFPLTVNVVIHRWNIDRLDEIVQMAEKLGARRLELASAQYYGWAMRNRAVLLPSREQIAHAEPMAIAQQQRLRGRMDVLYIVPDYFSDRPKPCMNGWARQYIAVNPRGDVLPCPTAGDIKSLKFDNVAEHSLGWIWARSDAFNRFRGTGWMADPCKSCDRREIDFGGCRCQAALVTGDAARTDPVCSLSADHHLIEKALVEATLGASGAPAEFLYRTSPIFSERTQ